MSKPNQWGADPAKYKRLCEPFDTKELAELAFRGFVGELAKLREKYRIPELIVQYECRVMIDDKVCGMHGGCGWGNQLYQAQLAKRALDQELDHLARVTEGLAASLPRVRRELITDPKPEDTVEGES